MEAAGVFHDGVIAGTIPKLIFAISNFQMQWEPVAVLTCALSSELFKGKGPGPKHLINLTLHVCSTLLLFLCFASMTQAVWPSALLAGLFAAHPINVEAVAWLALHDSSLNLFFLSLSLYFYIRYTRRAAISAYLLVIFFYLLALLSSPRIIAFPLLLILLDIWPLSRLRQAPGKPQKIGLHTLGRLRIKEKAPMLGIALLLGVSTLLMNPSVLLRNRITDFFVLDYTLVSYLTYLKRLLLFPGAEHNRFFQPFYPSTVDIIIAAIILIVISVTIFRLAKKNRPYLVVGWLWFLLALGPAVIINSLKHSLIEDHYAYLGAIGIYIMIAFGWREFFAGSSFRKNLGIILGVSLMLILTVNTRQQTQYWYDTLTLLQHTMAIAPARVDHQKAGDALLALGHAESAIPHYKTASLETPTDHQLYNNMGVAMLTVGQMQQAVDSFKRAIALDPAYATAYHNLGDAYLGKGETDKAVASFQKALEIRPSAQTYNSLAAAFVKKEEPEKAAACLKEALRINPYYENARQNLKLLQAQ